MHYPGGPNIITGVHLRGILEDQEDKKRRDERTQVQMDEGPRTKAGGRPPRSEKDKEMNPPWSL